MKCKIESEGVLEVQRLLEARKTKSAGAHLGEYYPKVLIQSKPLR